MMAKFQSKLSYHDNFQMDKVNSLEKEINTWMVLSLGLKTFRWMTICLVWLYTEGAWVNATKNFTLKFCRNNSCSTSFCSLESDMFLVLCLQRLFITLRVFPLDPCPHPAAPLQSMSGCGGSLCRAPSVVSRFQVTQRWVK